MDTQRRRDRDATEARVVNAAAELLAQGGAAALGVNALAKAAECDKQLIYRYFGGLDGVLAALGRVVADRLSAALAAALLSPAPDWPAFAQALARGLVAAYRSDPTLVHLRAAELAAPPGAVQALSDARGAVLSDWVKAVRPALPAPRGRDVPALVAILAGAIETAALSSAATGAVVGLPLRTDADWSRFESALAGLIATAFAPAPD